MAPLIGTKSPPMLLRMARAMVSSIMLLWEGTGTVHNR